MKGLAHSGSSFVLATEAWGGRPEGSFSGAEVTPTGSPRIHRVNWASSVGATVTRLRHAVGPGKDRRADRIQWRLRGRRSATGNIQNLHMAERGQYKLGGAGGRQDLNDPMLPARRRTRRRGRSSAISGITARSAILISWQENRTHRYNLAADSDGAASQKKIQLVPLSIHSIFQDHVMVTQLLGQLAQVMDAGS